MYCSGIIIGAYRRRNSAFVSIHLNYGIFHSKFYIKQYKYVTLSANVSYDDVHIDGVRLRL
jgi:hypothetical protein